MAAGIDNRGGRGQHRDSGSAAAIALGVEIARMQHLDAPVDDDEVLEPPMTPVVATALRHRDHLATAAAQERRPAVERVVDGIEPDE